MARYLEYKFTNDRRCVDVSGIKNTFIIESALLFQLGLTPKGEYPRSVTPGTFTIGLNNFYEYIGCDDEFTADDALADGDFPAYKFYLERANKIRTFRLHPRITVYTSDNAAQLVDVFDDCYYFTVKTVSRSRLKKEDLFCFQTIIRTTKHT